MAASEFSAKLGSLRRLLPPIGSWQAYLLALGFLSVGALARLPFDDAINERLPPFLTVYPAVVLAGLAGGLRVSAATALVGGAMAWLLWAAPYGWEIPPYAAVVFTAYALAVGITVCGSGAARHLLDAVSALERERARQAQETVHRIKNLIAIVQALSHKIADEGLDQEAYMRSFDQRLRALGEAQDILVRSDWQATDLQTLVETALAPFANAQLQIVGGPQRLAPARFVSGLSLALYELGTNATKYGALSGESGTVTVAWREADGRTVLEWREAGTTVQSGEMGLGSALIRGALSASGTVTYDARPGAIVCVFDWPNAAP